MRSQTQQKMLAGSIVFREGTIVVASGKPSNDAARLEQQHFRQRWRAVWGFTILEALWQDWPDGARMLLKAPRFTAVAVALLLG